MTPDHPLVIFTCGILAGLVAAYYAVVAAERFNAMVRSERSQGYRRPSFIP